MTAPITPAHVRGGRRRFLMPVVGLSVAVQLLSGVPPSRGQAATPESTVFAQNAVTVTTTTKPPLSGPRLTLPPAPEPPPTPSTTATTNPPVGPTPSEPGPAPTESPQTTVPADGAPSTGTEGGDDSTTTTSVPEGDADKAPVVPGEAESATTPPPGGGDAGKEAPRLGDEQVARILESLERSGANSTGALLDALRPLVDLGIAPRDAAILGTGHFPVAGPATFRDDWHDPRSTPTPHLHMGNDIFAAFGTPARAPVEGVVRFAEEGAGGKAAYVTVPDGTWYYLAHLESFAPDLKTGDKVPQGTVVGFVGDSGNARGGAPHVHFEIHPLGGEAVNPKPILDAWLQEALASAPALVAAFTPPEQRVLSATNELRQMEVAIPGAAPQSASVLMWSSTVSAGGGTVRLAEAAAARVASHVDWWRVELAAQARDILARQAKADAYELLAPLTHKALVPILGSGS